MRPARNVVVAILLTMLAVSGCSGTPPESVPAGTDVASRTAGAGTPSAPSDDNGARYVLPEEMCPAVDTSALADLYPDPVSGESHMINSSRTCGTTLKAGSRALGLSLEVLLVDESLLAAEPSLAREWYEGERRFATSDPTDIGGVGSGAFWYGDEHQVTLLAYDGNLNLKLWVHAVGDSHKLAPDMPDRVAAVATATMARLAR